MADYFSDVVQRFNPGEQLELVLTTPLKEWYQAVWLHNWKGCQQEIVLL